MGCIAAAPWHLRFPLTLNSSMFTFRSNESRSLRRRGFNWTAAFDTAIATYPDQRFTLRNGILVSGEHPARY